MSLGATKTVDRRTATTPQTKWHVLENNGRCDILYRMIVSLYITASISAITTIELDLYTIYHGLVWWQ